jgi:hypothetical protein
MAEDNALLDNDPTALGPAELDEIVGGLERPWVVRLDEDGAQLPFDDPFAEPPDGPLGRVTG